MIETILLTIVVCLHPMFSPATCEQAIVSEHSTKEACAAAASALIEKSSYPIMATCFEVRLGEKTDA